MKKNRCKKKLLYAVSVFLFFMGGCGPSGSVTEEEGRAVLDSGQGTEQEEMAADHLLTVWSDYLQVHEDMYASVLWASDHIEQYLDTGDWEDLSKARTACIASARYLSDLSMTEEDISDEEYAVLAKGGADTTFQSIEIGSVPSRIDDEHTFVRGQMLEALEGGIFLSDDIETLQEEVSLHREVIAYWCRNECLTTNYLLLTLGGGERATAYWEAMPGKYPVLSTGYGEWEDNEHVLEDNAEQCLDQVEEATLRQADLLSSVRADLYNREKAVKDNDVGQWIASAFVMDDIPELLPMPDWYDPQTARYLSYIQDEDGTIACPASGDALEEAPYGVYIQIEGVSAQEIADYITEIQASTQGIRKDPHTDTWDIAMTDYHIRFSLEERTATVIFDGQDVTFVPVWYLDI